MRTLHVGDGGSGQLPVLVWVIFSIGSLGLGQALFAVGRSPGLPDFGSKSAPVGDGDVLLASPGPDLGGAGFGRLGSIGYVGGEGGEGGDPVEGGGLAVCPGGRGGQESVGV